MPVEQDNLHQNVACQLIFTNNFKRFDMDARKIACYYGVAPLGKNREQAYIPQQGRAISPTG